MDQLRDMGHEHAEVLFIGADAIMTRLSISTDSQVLCLRQRLAMLPPWASGCPQKYERPPAQGKGQPRGPDNLVKAQPLTLHMREASKATDAVFKDKSLVSFADHAQPQHTFM
jgi:hypothetical protein